MRSSSEVMGDAQNKFLKTRRGESKKYTRLILNFLVERREQDPEGWARAKEIRDQNICSEQNLFRLIADLVDENIIERNPKRARKHQNEVYYRIPPAAENVEFYTYEELYDINNKELFELTGKNVELQFELYDALEVLKRNNLLPEYEQEREKTKNIGEGREKWKERKLRESQIKSFSLSEPSKSSHNQ